MTDVVTVGLGERSYEVRIGAGLLAEAGSDIKPLLRRPKVAVITEDNVAALHQETLSDALGDAGIAQDWLSLPPGEGTKSWAQIQHVVEWLLEREIARDDVVIAFGGGVIGDLVGFAAAILRRGVSFVQIPTSLLAQVDSSVGGKTGINSPHGKNLVGAFHQPKLVLADIALLDTLTPRDFLSGYAEVAKYGLLGDADFFTWLEQNGPAIRDGSRAARQKTVTHSVQMKADIVARDERESGERALLNLGHTFGHALEAATGYSDRLLHGEGVATGCVLAFALSARMGLCAQELPGRVAAHFAEMGLPHQVRDIPGDLPDADGLLKLMGQDKKVKDGRLTFILARAIGEAFVTQDVAAEDVRKLLYESLSDNI
ncbi:3-dehydroquinate synthase [Paracoccaceae bacterium GXU_MW_L88]